MNVLIVDDEPLARQRIRTLLKSQQGIGEIREGQNGLEAVDVLSSWSPDIVFLDVQMPGLDGFGVVERIGAEQMPVTIFVTAYDEFALRAFEAQALDYLLKPFEAERLHQAIERARKQLSRAGTGGVQEQFQSLLNALGQRSSYLDRFIVRTGARITFVPVAEVDWIGAEGNYLSLHAGGRTHLVRETMASVESKLDPQQFLRVHRSTILNLGRLRAVESLFRGEYMLILEDGTRLQSGGSYRERIETTLLSR